MRLYSTKWLDTSIFYLHRENKTFDQQFIYCAASKYAADLSICFHICNKQVTEWPSIVKIAAHSAYDMFSWYKYLIVNLVFPHLGFWSGIFFLIVPFPIIQLRYRKFVGFFFYNFLKSLTNLHQKKP